MFEPNPFITNPLMTVAELEAASFTFATQKFETAVDITGDKTVCGAV